jgi:hypothetical protein
MNALGLASLILLTSGLGVLGATAGCSSSSGTTAADGGPNTPDAATCGKLPAAGPSQVVPVDTDPDTETGKDAAFALDAKGRPFFAYIQYKTTTTGSLYTLSWDDCTGAWRAPVVLDTAIVETESRSLSISVDASDGRVAVAYAKTVPQPPDNNKVAAYLAISSDAGKTFATPVEVSKHGTGDANDVDEVRVALGGGKTFVAYNQTGAACGTAPPGGQSKCRGGSVLATLTGGAYTYEVVKDGNTGDTAPFAVTRGLGIGLALDSGNVPALALHLEPSTGSNTQLVYWRPGGATVSKIYDSENQQNDDSDVSLAFDGLKPRIVSRLAGPTANADVYFAASDDGTTWGAKVGLPRPEHITYSQNIVVASGKVFVFAGGPHVFVSQDLKTFDVADLGLAQTSGSVTGAVDSSGKYWVGLEGSTPGNDGKNGVVLFRQP